MSLAIKFCKEKKCNKYDKRLLQLLEEKFHNKIEKILLTNKSKIYDELILPIGMKKINQYLELSNKKDVTVLIMEFRKFLLINMGEKVEITKIKDEDLFKIEKNNKLPKYTLIDEKTFYASKSYKIYGRKLFGIYSKILREVKKNQTYKKKLDFTDKQKILAECSGQAYHYSIKDIKLRPKSFIDPVHNTIYEYKENLSDENKSIWINEDKNVFNNKILILAFRGTGLFVNDKKFSLLGNWKRDKKLDYDIALGNLYKSKEMKKIISEYDKLYEIYKKDYKIYLTGHSLGGRIAFEIHRARPRKVKECHIFNAGFGLDIKYLHDILQTQKRNYIWEKNLYTYHIGGEKKEPDDDDFISVLSGGYGVSYTFYGNFNKKFKGHSINNFL